MTSQDEEWRQKGATLSDKTARKEFGLTEDEIIGLIASGQLSYRIGVMHGNPWYRLLRSEIEQLMLTTFNDQEHRKRRAKAELARVNRDLKLLRDQLAELEAQRAQCLAVLAE